MLHVGLSEIQGALAPRIVGEPARFALACRAGRGILIAVKVQLFI